jgi:hypothetical protein
MQSYAIGGEDETNNSPLGAWLCGAPIVVQSESRDILCHPTLAGWQWSVSNIPTLSIQDNAQ